MVKSILKLETCFAELMFLALQSNIVVKVVLNIAVLCMGMRCTNLAGHRIVYNIVCIDFAVSVLFPVY